MTLPPVSCPGQPYPHPYRERGAMASALEERFEIDGTTTRVIRWTYGGGWNRREPKVRVTKHRTARDARAALDAIVAARVAEGWAPLPAWPETPVPWVATTTPAKNEAPPRARVSASSSGVRAAASPVRAAAPLRMSSLRIVGRKAPAKARDLVAFEEALATTAPESWAKLLRDVGHGVLCKRLEVFSPDAAVRATKRLRKTWTDEALRKAFVRFDEIVGARARDLVAIARSLSGDQVVFVAGRPDRMFVLPRSHDEIVGATSLASVLGYFFRVARDVDGADAPAYEPAAML
ncbi:MAG: hypothetical protein JST00_15085 [Deltaproteobacteria bacterium]|nr:hypothetical protein [Deltaproteobacteria bacterium]